LEKSEKSERRAVFDLACEKALRDAKGSYRQPRLKQKTPEQQDAQNQGDCNDDDLDQTHG
jgi:hypothetical protein